MDWKLFLATFSAIFVAELGDKTQIAAIAVSAQAKGVLEVLLAVVFALSLAGCMGVLAGKILAIYLTPQFLKYFSGTLFQLFLHPIFPAYSTQYTRNPAS